MKRQVFWLCFFLSITSTAHAGEYFRNKWFEYPDPTTPPKVTTKSDHTTLAHSSGEL